MELLQSSDIEKFLNVRVISSEQKMRKPDPQMFRLALVRARRKPEEYIMVEIG